MVDRRWAITMQVRPSLALSRASCTVCHGHKNTHMKQCSQTHTHTHRQEPLSVLPHSRHTCLTIIAISQSCVDYYHYNVPVDLCAAACCVLLSVVQPSELEKLLHGPTDRIHLKEALLEGWLGLLLAGDNNRDDE